MQKAELRSRVALEVTCTVGCVDVIGIALTSLVGIAGILSTHLLARSQRTSDNKRWTAERRDRYDFTRYETVASICAEFVGLLSGIEASAKIRQMVRHSTYERILNGLPEKIREQAAATKDSNLAPALSAFAEQLDAYPDLAQNLAQNAAEGLDESTVPPPIVAPPIIQRLAELAARLQILGGNDLAEAAERAQAIASATMLRLTANEVEKLNTSVDLEPLKNTIGHFVSAAIYETRLQPHGEKMTFQDLIKQAREETSTDAGGDEPGTS